MHKVLQGKRLSLILERKQKSLEFCTKKLSDFRLRLLCKHQIIHEVCGSKISAEVHSRAFDGCAEFECIGVALDIQYPSESNSTRSSDDKSTSVALVKVEMSSLEGSRATKKSVNQSIDKRCVIYVLCLGAHANFTRLSVKVGQKVYAKGSLFTNHSKSLEEFELTKLEYVGPHLLVNGGCGKIRPMMISGLVH